NNLIQGGIGNGITLGSLELVNAGGDIVRRIIGWVVNADDPCDPCQPGSVFVPPGTTGPGGATYRSAGWLTDITIERNRISDMGLCGIGVIAFFDLSDTADLVMVNGLAILGNTIRHCLRRPIEA